MQITSLISISIAVIQLVSGNVFVYNQYSDLAISSYNSSVFSYRDVLYYHSC